MFNSAKPKMFIQEIRTWKSFAIMSKMAAFKVIVGQWSVTFSQAFRTLAEWIQIKRSNRKMLVN